MNIHGYKRTYYINETKLKLNRNFKYKSTGEIDYFINFII